MKESIFTGSIWELQDENVKSVFTAIISRYGPTKSRRVFAKQLEKYLFERGVKMMKIDGRKVYYRDDDGFYEKYLNFCESKKLFPLSKEEFYKDYCRRAIKED